MMTQTQIATLPLGPRRWRLVPAAAGRGPAPADGPLGSARLVGLLTALGRAGDHRPPPPSPAKVEAGKRRIMALAARRRDARTV